MKANSSIVKAAADRNEIFFFGADTHKDIVGMIAISQRGDKGLLQLERSMIKFYLTDVHDYFLLCSSQTAYPTAAMVSAIQAQPSWPAPSLKI